VGDEQVGQAELGAQPLEQVEHLGLDEHVQGRHRLVADDQRRVECDGARDGHPLGLAAGQLAGPAPAVAGRVQSDQLEQIVYPLAALVLAARLIGDERLLDQVPDRPLGVQRAERVLEHHLQVPAGLQQPGAAQGGQVGAAEDDLTGRGPRGLQHRTRQRRLARPGLAHDAERLPRPHVEGHAGDGLDHARVGVELLDQVAYLQERLSHDAPH
jgi:hypothetical protein